MLLSDDYPVLSLVLESCCSSTHVLPAGNWPGQLERVIILETPTEGSKTGSRFRSTNLSPLGHGA